MTTPRLQGRPELLPLGQDAVLVRFSRVSSQQATAAVLAFRDHFEARGVTGITELAGSLGSVMVGFDPAVTTRAKVTAALDESLEGRDWLAGALPKVRRRWRVPVGFGAAFAPDLDEAASLAGLSPEKAVQAITGLDLRVLAIGFAPGQPYLGLLPKTWDLARRSALVHKVPAGALITAVRQLIIFTNQSTTGWRQVGLCAFRPFLRDRGEPFVLRHGDVVRFEPVADDTMRALLADNPGGLGGARCEVLA